VQILHHATAISPVILMWLLDFWQVCASLSLAVFDMENTEFVERTGI
jgi:hypothetical protein